MYWYVFFISCSDTSSGLEADSQIIKTRNDNCTITDIDDDPTQCDGFESIDLVGDEIHFSFDERYFDNISECLDNTFLFDPKKTTIVNTPNCGERDIHPLWCTDVDDEILIVDLGPIESSGTIELCFVTECSDFQQLMIDCITGNGFHTSYEPDYCPECDADPGLGTFCFEIEITCM